MADKDINLSDLFYREFWVVDKKKKEYEKLKPKLASSDMDLIEELVRELAEYGNNEQKLEEEERAARIKLASSIPNIMSGAFSVSTTPSENFTVRKEEYKGKYLEKVSDATFNEGDLSTTIPNPVVKEVMEITEVPEEDLPSKFPVNTEVVHIDTRKRGVILSHATHLPLAAIVKFETGEIKVVNMKELVRADEFEHGFGEEPYSPSKQISDELLEKETEEFMPKPHEEVKNPILERIENIKEAIRNAITDPIVSQKIVTYLLENGIIDLDLDSFLNTIKVLSSVEKVKLANLLIENRVLSPKLASDLARYILSQKLKR